MDKNMTTTAQLHQGECHLVTLEKVVKICWAKQNCNCLFNKGGYGRLYKGKWKENPEASESIEVAVKLPVGHHQVDYEIATLKKVNGHRNILRFYGQIECGPHDLIVTELCNGTLHDLIVIKKDSLTQISSHQLRDDVVLRQIVEGVKHLHDNEIIHRGLTPRNILYRIDPLVMKLADFGSSRSVTGDATHYTRTVTGSGYSKYFCLFGTNRWLAPEVLCGVTELRPPHAVDIYPLGLIFAFTLCGGRHPYGEDAKAIKKRIKNKQPMLEDIRQQLIDEHGDGCYDLINRMLDSNPEKRPTASQVLEDAFFQPRLNPEVRYEVT